MGITREKNGNLEKLKNHSGVFTLGAWTPNFSSVGQLFCFLGLPKVHGHTHTYIIHTFWDSSSTEVENSFFSQKKKWKMMMVCTHHYFSREPHSDSLLSSKKGKVSLSILLVQNVQTCEERL